MAAGRAAAEVPHRRPGGARCSPPPTRWPRWIDAALDRETPFKCTAGLHDAVATTTPSGFTHHGFLNVLVATVRAFDGAATDEVVALLEQRDAGALVAAARDERPRRARRWFTSFGSCSVTEPLDDLIALGLLESHDHDTWVDGAAGSLFDVDNLPYGVFSRGGEEPRVGVRIGDLVLDVAPVAAAEMLDVHHVFQEPSLNPLMAEGRQVRDSLRTWLTGLLTDETERDLVEPHLRAARRGRRCTCRSRSPTTSTSTPRSSTPPTSAGCSAPTPRRCCPTGGTSRSATTAAPAPSWPAAPTWSGRRASGRRRPRTPRRSGPRAGSTSRPSSASSSAPGRRSATGSPPTSSPTTSSAWSGSTTGRARDIQAWEYVPLGPFLGKSFATSISHWVTPLEALDAAWVDLPGQDPEPLPYLRRGRPRGLDIDVEVELDGEVVSRPPYRSMYWSPAQMLAHLTVNGASLRTGDLFASGTVSGPERDQRGSLLELSWGGKEPLRRRPDVPRGRRQGHPALHRARHRRRPDRARRGDRDGRPRPLALEVRRPMAIGSAPRCIRRRTIASDALAVAEAGVDEGLAAAHRLDGPGVHPVQVGEAAARGSAGSARCRSAQKRYCTDSATRKSSRP